jgi:hypothetical protein
MLITLLGGNCAKFEIGIAPNGRPIFVTRAYGGSTSEKGMLESENFTTWYKEVLLPTCMDEDGKPFKPDIMADRGTRIKSICDELGCEYVRPRDPSGFGLTRQDTDFNERVSKARAHVENVVRI